MKKLKTAIVGCENVGHFHARALANLENSEFVLVCSTSIAKATVLVNPAPHQLDLLLSYMGDIDEVYGSGRTLTTITSKSKTGRRPS